MTEQRARELLKPCPFCGAEAKFIADDSYGGCGVGCLSGCEAEPYCSANKDEPEKAISAWNTRATPFAESAKSPSDSVSEALAIEQVAQFLHDEGGFDEAWSNHTWPEHADDTGQRDGGFVKIVPSDVQAKFRDVARRLLTMPIARAALQSIKDQGNG